MNRLSRFLGLSGRERALLLQATILLATIRLGLAALSFARLRDILSRLAAPGMTGNTTKDQLGGDERKRVVWAVETVSRHFPAIGTCLTQALAAHVLLGRRGQKSNLRIGVARNAVGKFVAHAWLEKDGVILIGETWRRNYTPMPVLNGLEP